MFPACIVQSPASLELADWLLVVLVVAGVKNAAELSLDSLSDVISELGADLTGDGLLN